MMEELHRRLIRIGLDALAEDYGHARLGGLPGAAASLAASTVSPALPRLIRVGAR